MTKQDGLIIYQLENGALELKADFNSETIWASQKDIALIFDIDRSVITKHIKNIYSDGEVDKESTSAKTAQVQKEGSRTIKRNIDTYNLDIILAVGYRTSSSKAINFRKWATQTLKQHITNGYTINKSRVESDPKFLLDVVTSLNEMSNNQLNTDDTVELIKTFSYTWFSLQSYDEQKYPKTDSSNDIDISVNKLYSDLAVLKSNLIDKKEATVLFGQEKNQGSLDSIFKNVFQNVFGQELYPSIEEKAAHILYFLVKNHPFNDGNKRSGAYAFIWLLKSFNYKHRITPETLATLTILIAESSPNDKDKMIGMVLLLLAGQKDVI
jgi:death-on-curing family protein